MLTQVSSNRVQKLLKHAVYERNTEKKVAMDASKPIEIMHGPYNSPDPHIALYFLNAVPTLIATAMHIEQFTKWIKNFNTELLCVDFKTFAFIC